MAADSTSSCAKQLERRHRAVTPPPCSDPCPGPGGLSPGSVPLSGPGRCWACSPPSPALCPAGTGAPPARGSPWRRQQELLEEEEAAMR